MGSPEKKTEAHKAAVEAAKPGIKCSELDKIARDIISEGGYGDYFVHGLGHGLSAAGQTKGGRGQRRRGDEEGR